MADEPTLPKEAPEAGSAEPAEKSAGAGDAGVEEPPAGPLLSVEDLRVGFRIPRQGVAEVVRGVSFSLDRGASLAVVGESGSGKSVTALALARLLPDPPARILGGRVLFDGTDTLRLRGKALRKVRGAGIAYVFQDPSTSLNPVFSIRNQMAEVMRLHRPDIPASDHHEEIIQWLYRVGIVEPEKRLRDYPHQLSGGMQQRIMIAMALCCRPKLLIADEPTTALDVTIQAQILDLLAELREELSMALILITHNFGIIDRVADEVAVMCRGKIVETGKTSSVLNSPGHPYTRALIGCVPKLGAARDRLPTIPEDVFAEEDGAPAEDSA